jgi:alkylation response protein AidB-like acyl-CoA dehydrogenase
MVVFPLGDVVGADGEPLPVSAHEFIAEQIGAEAATIDSAGVPRELLLALGQHGLFGRPLDVPAAQRELTELIAGADGDTWFCWAQHATPLRTLQLAAEPGPWAAQWREPLQSGSAIAAVAFAHLRRPGQPNPVARRVPHGWRIDGNLDWITSWDIADVVLLMVRDENDQIVQVMLPAGAGAAMDGFRVGPVLDLFAMRGTHTRPAQLDNVMVSDDYVVDVLPLDDWRAADDAKTIDASPAAFGVTRSAIAELAQLAEERSSDTLRELVWSLSKDCRDLRHLAYAALDGGVAISREERLGIRARSLDLTIRASTAVVTARAGAAMRAGESAERRIRTAMFLQVQAQTAATRESSLRLAISESESLVESKFPDQHR